MQNLLAEHSAFLKSAHVHPNSAFPATKEGMNAQLLRKRLHPDVEDWVDKRRRTGQSLGQEAPSATATGDEMPVDAMASGDWRKLWDWAAPEAIDIAKKYFPELDPNHESESDEEEAPAREVVPAKEPMALDDIMKFMSTGNLGVNQGG